MADRYLDLLPLEDLRADPRNPKAHDLPLLGDSLGRFGFVEPIVIDERTGLLAAGHGRVEELRALRSAGAAPPEGVELDSDGRWRVPAVRGWSSKDDIEAAAYLVGANRTSEAGGWRRDVLADMLGELAEADGGLLGVGYLPSDLPAILTPDEEIEFNDPGGTASTESSLTEKAESYRNSQVRSMVFDYTLAAYEEVNRLAARARSSHGVPSNAELFMALLAEAP